MSRTRDFANEAYSTDSFFAAFPVGQGPGRSWTLSRLAWALSPPPAAFPTAPNRTEGPPPDSGIRCDGLQIPSRRGGPVLWDHTASATVAMSRSSSLWSGRKGSDLLEGINSAR